MIWNTCNERIPIPFVRPSEMMLGLTQGRKLPNLIMHNIIWANQKNASFVHPWLGTHTPFSNVLSCNCQSIWHHFKHSVKRLIARAWIPQKLRALWTFSISVSSCYLTEVVMFLSWHVNVQVRKWKNIQQLSYFLSKITINIILI